MKQMTFADAEKYRQSYESALIRLAREAGAGVAGSPGISVKLSALHPKYNIFHAGEAKAAMVPVIRDLAVRARDADIHFTIDAEEAERVLGKAIEREYNLFDLLRRPGVSYDGLMGMDGGKYAPVTKAGEVIALLTGFLGVCMAAIMTGIVASAFATQVSRKKHAYRAQLMRVLEDGEVSEAESDSLKRLQQQFRLSDHEVQAILDEYHKSKERNA